LSRICIIASCLVTLARPFLSPRMDGHSDGTHSPPKVDQHPLSASSSSTLRESGPHRDLVNELLENAVKAGTRAPEALEEKSDEWEDGPENPRNWSTGKKWTAVSIVCPSSLPPSIRIDDISRSRCTHLFRLSPAQSCLLAFLTSL